jgi:putative flippase GtrA
MTDYMTQKELTRVNLTINYTIFALIATISNICSQVISIQLYSGTYALPVSLIIGTLVGLLIKYQLDKQYIFHYVTDSITHDSKTFFIYTIMGVVTTCIFFAFELSFNYLFKLNSMRYLGGVIGLSIGYFMKYHLDKRFVFLQQGP